MPLSFVAILGGMTTLIGSSTNLLVSNSLKTYANVEIGFFDITLPGLVIAFSGFVFIIVFSNSGNSAKLVSAMRPAAKVVTISPNINVSRQVSLLWGVQSINSRDASGWKDMMSISKEIIKKLKFIKKNDFVVITAGLPFGKAGMTNMVRLYKVGT